jgi:hypothetical protein
LAEGAGPVFTEFLAGELRNERDRRSALDQRGITIVTSSSTLVTLLSALAAFVALKEGNPTPGLGTVVAFSFALAAFVLAAYFGLLTNRSRRYDVIAGEGLTLLRESEYWDRSADDARWIMFGRNVDTLTTLRSANDEKSRLVNYGLLAQLIALFFLALTIVLSMVDVLIR